MREEQRPMIPDVPGVPGLPDLPDFPGTPGAPRGPGDREPLSETLARRLFEQRVVLLHGPLEDRLATRVSAELMTLDAEGDEPVSLRVDCGEGRLALALTLMDVVELMGVPVRALCLGQVGEGAVGIVSVCAQRVALPNTRFALREPVAEAPAPVHVRNVAPWAELRADERDRFCARVAAAAHKPVEVVRDDVVRGRYLSAGEAVAYGLIDQVCEPAADVRRLPPPPGPPMGFRPQR